MFCSRSGALGNYFRQLPMAFVVSVLTEQALVLSCDRPMFDRGRPINITRHMRTGRSSMWFAWVSVIGYAAVCNVQGRMPDQLPMLSPAAKAMVDMS